MQCIFKALIDNNIDNIDSLVKYIIISTDQGHHSV